MLILECYYAHSNSASMLMFTGFNVYHEKSFNLRCAHANLQIWQNIQGRAKAECHWFCRNLVIHKLNKINDSVVEFNLGEKNVLKIKALPKLL